MSCRQLEEQRDPGGSRLRSRSEEREKEGARFGLVRAFGAAFSLVLKALVGLSFSKRSSSGGLSHSFPWEASRSARATVWARSLLSRLFRGCVAESPLSLVAHPRELPAFEGGIHWGKASRWGRIKGYDSIAGKNDEFCIENYELCIKIDELCIKNDAFCI